MKKKLLVVVHHLTIGGVQKSLLSFLKAIDYELYDVTLYLRKNRTVLLPYVDKRVNVIVNDDNTHYYRRPKAVYFQLMEFIFGKVNVNKKKCYKEKLLSYLVESSMSYEYNKYFKDKYFDIAVSYDSGYDALFVADYINAKKKIVGYHTSTKDLPEINEKILPKFNTIFVEHLDMKNLLSSWYSKVDDRIQIVSNYIDLSLINEQSDEFSVETPDDKIILCTCGRLSKVKGFDIAVEAADVLKKNNISFLWYFVGDGPEKNNIEAKIKECGLVDDIIITGMKTNPYPYIKHCDIYVQPSYADAQPLSVLEAQRLLKPVVATATIGGGFLVKNGYNGLLSDINGETLGKKLVDLINDKNKFNSIVNNVISIDYSFERNNYYNTVMKLLEE